VRRFRLRNAIKQTTGDFVTLVEAIEKHAKAKQTSADPYSVARTNDDDDDGGGCGGNGNGNGDGDHKAVVPMHAQHEVLAWRQQVEKLASDKSATNIERVDALAELVPSVRISIDTLIRGEIGCK
jgi:hypothetical protein